MKARLTQSIDIQLKPSYLLLGLLSAISILCCIIVWQLPVQTAIKLGVIGLIVLTSIYFILRDALLLLAQSWLRIEVNSRGELRLLNKQGQQIAPKLSEASFIHYFLVILVFEKTHLFSWSLPPVILFTNRDNQNQLRHLRIWLLWWKHHSDNSVADSADV